MSECVSQHHSGIPTDDPTVNGFFLERYFGKCGKVSNTKLYRNEAGLIKGDALVSYASGFVLFRLNRERVERENATANN